MNKFFNIFSGIVLLSLSQSCFMQQEDLFEQSAMERLEARKVEIVDVLSSASNGWVMQYFPTGEAGVPGYLLLVKFDKSGENGTVQFAAKNDVTKNKYVITDGSDPEYPESLFDVVFDSGPVLTFNSYNNLFHKFSDPNATGLPNDQGLGTGIGGDYEFVVISMEPEEYPTTVVLKGKKRGTYTVLKRLADDVVWEDYFNEVDALNNRFYKNNPAPLRLVCGKSEFDLYNGASSIFQVVELGSNELQYAESHKFIQTVDGLRFDVPFEYDGLEAGQNFYYNSELDRMESYIGNDASKGVLAYIDGGVAGDYYVNSIEPDQNGDLDSYWTIQTTEMGPAFAEVFNKAKSAMDAKKFTNLKLFLMGRKLGVEGSPSMDALHFEAKGLKRELYWREFSRAMVGREEFKYNYEAEVNAQSEYMKAFFTTVSEMEELYNIFPAHQWKVTAADKYNFTILRLSSVENPDMWFDVKYVEGETKPVG